MGAIPREARDGLMRAWLDILQERHPGVTWVPLSRQAATSDAIAGVDTEHAIAALAQAA